MNVYVREDNYIVTCKKGTFVLLHYIEVTFNQSVSFNVTDPPIKFTPFITDMSTFLQLISARHTQKHI